MELLQISYIISASILIVIAAFLFYLYYRNQTKMNVMKKKAKDYDPGSLKGWWYSYKYVLFLYIGFACLIVAISFFAIALGI